MNNIIEAYRGGRGRSGGYGRSGGFSYGGGRSSSGRGSTSSGSYRGRGGDYRGSARVSSVGSSIMSSSSNSSKISGSSLRPSFGLNSDNFYSGKNKPNKSKPTEKKTVKPMENPYRQTSTSNTKGVYGGSQWFGWGPSVLYPIVDEPPEIIASMNDNNIQKNEVMSISEYDEKVKKRYRH